MRGTHSRDGAPDLMVVGAGTMGAWTALWAARAGIATTLVDAWGAGNPRATSGDESRIIRSSHGEDAFYTRWSRRAREHWLRFGEEWGEQLLTQTGALWFASSERGYEAASEATLRAEGIPVERLSVDEVARRWPQIDPAELAFAIHEPEAGALAARRATAAAARAFERAGGHVDVAELRPGRASGSRLLEIVGSDGTVRSAAAFVFACGPWLPRLFPDVLGDVIRVTKQDVFYVGPPAGDARFDADHLPCWVEEDAAVYGIPALTGRGFKIGPDRAGPIFDPTDGERLVDPDQLRVARSYLARRFPALASRPVVETRVCQYEMTPDSHFLIDRHPAWENVWLVGGGSGHGFKHGPRIGEYVVARLLGAEEGAQDGPDERRFRLAGRGSHAAPSGVSAAAGMPMRGTSRPA